MSICSSIVMEFAQVFKNNYNTFIMFPLCAIISYTGYSGYFPGNFILLSGTLCPYIDITYLILIPQKHGHAFYLIHIKV